MITIAWVNYTAADKRGPQKKFVEYVVGFKKVTTEEIRVVALFPFDTQDTTIYRAFEENDITYYECKVARYGWLVSPRTEARITAYAQLLENIEYMKKLLQEIQCDIVVSNCSLVWEAAYAAKALGIKHVLFLRGIFNPSYLPPNILELPMLRILETQLLQLADVAVTQSDFTAKLWGLEKQSCKKAVIPVGCSVTSNWEPLSFTEDTLKVLVLSGLENYKNQAIIIQVARALKQRGYKVEFNIYGAHKDIEYRRMIESQIEALNLKECIHIRAYEEDIDKLYLTHHLLFISSSMETFGVTACEAMGRCRPVISTKSGGPEETIVEGVTGFLADAVNKEELVSKFCLVLENKTLIEQMGKAGRQRWEEKYQLPVVLRQWMKLLQEEVEDGIKKEPDTIQNLLEEVRKQLKLPQVQKELHQSKVYSNKKNWLLVAKNIYSPGVLIGIKNSLEQLEKEEEINYKLIENKEAINYIDWADVVVFARAVDQSMCKLLDQFKTRGKKTLYYVDDSLYEVPSSIKNGRSYNTPEVAEALTYFIQQTDCLVACSPWLAQSYKERYGCMVTWINPAIKVPSIKPFDKKQSPLLIGFSGNVDYKELLENLKPMFIKLYGRYKESIQFEFCGPKVSFLEEIKALYYKPMAYEMYEMLLARRQWDIGIAYIEESSFSNKKFYNKYLEYSRFGICGIYSNTELFRRIINNGYNGVLVENREEAWYSAIENLIQKETLRKDMARVAQNHVLDYFSVEKGAREVRNKLSEFL